MIDVYRVRQLAFPEALSRRRAGLRVERNDAVVLRDYEEHLLVPNDVVREGRGWSPQ